MCSCVIYVEIIKLCQCRCDVALQEVFEVADHLEILCAIGTVYSLEYSVSNGYIYITNFHPGYNTEACT